MYIFNFILAIKDFIMSRYSVNLKFTKPSGGSGGNKWFNVNASSESEARREALDQAKSSEPTYTWQVIKVNKLD